MSENQEIEVEVVEVVDKEPSSRPSTVPASRSTEPGPDGSQRPFGRGIPIRSLRIPGYLWPLAIIFGIILFLLAVLLFVFIALPLLILRAILRLFR